MQWSFGDTSYFYSRLNGTTGNLYDSGAVEIAEKTITWYAGSAALQMNSKGAYGTTRTYYYTAIG